MLGRLPWGVALSFVAALAVSVSTAMAESNSSRLRQLAARQDLSDEVCYARADGNISSKERASLLQFAHEILSPQEYQAFKQSIDRLSPPKPSAPKRQIAKGSKSSKSAKAAYAAKRQNQPFTSLASLLPTLPTLPKLPNLFALPQRKAEAAAGPVIPAGAMLPDRMAPLGELRYSQPVVGPVIPAGAMLPDRMVPTDFLR